MFFSSHISLIQTLNKLIKLVFFPTCNQEADIYKFCVLNENSSRMHNFNYSFLSGFSITIWVPFSYIYSFEILLSNKLVTLK